MSDSFDDTAGENSPPNIGGSLVRSFVAVVGGIVVATFGYFFLILTAILLFFPDTRQQLTAPRDAEVEQQVKIELPHTLLLFSPLLQGFAAIAGGYIAARFAPTAPTGHAGMVAGFLVLTAVQMLLKNDGPFPEWVVGINTIVGPACTMWGASFVARKSVEDDQDEQPGSDESQ